MLSAQAPLVTPMTASSKTHGPVRSLEGSRKDMINSLQKQIDFHLSETCRLRTVQNSHIAISQLPAELLSDVFLYVVEAGLRGEDTYFAIATFAFLQVCKRWNEVALACPQLWVWWIPGTFKAWHLFKSRSKDAPLFLTWNEDLPAAESARTVLMELEPPKRIRQLDFTGTAHQFERTLNVLDSRAVSTTLSIRLRTFRFEEEERLAHFFSLPFPNLSELDVMTFLPDPTSPIFITSNLTSLKLNIPRHCNSHYTQSQLLQVLQQNRNLQQLDFKAGALPLDGDSGGSVPVLLPRLVDLRLHGTNEVIDRFLGLVRMSSSPLHKIAIDFQNDYYHNTEPIVNTTQKLLTAYYGRKELQCQRKVSHIALLAEEGTVSAKNDSTHPTSSLELKFQSNEDELLQKVTPLFPLDHIHDCTAGGLYLATDAWREILLRMEGLSHLRLENVNNGSVLGALGSGGVSWESIPILNRSRFRGQPRSTGLPQAEITVIERHYILRRGARKFVRCGGEDA